MSTESRLKALENAEAARVAANLTPAWKNAHVINNAAIADHVDDLEERVAALEGPVDPPPDPPDPPEPPVYAATFQGTNTGNQAASFAAFIKDHPGAKVAVKGIVRVQGARNSPAVLVDKAAGAVTTIDFLEGASVQCTGVSYGILNFPASTGDLVFNDLIVIGSGYIWNGVEDPDGVEDALAFYGGDRVTFNRPTVHDNRGDGLYMGSGTNGIKIVDGKFYRNARNGVGHVAGDFQFIGGSIDQSGLHNLDLEPNNVADAQTMSMTVKGVRLTKHDNIPVVAGSGYAIGGEWGGGASGIKIKMDIQNCSADRFRVAVSNMKNMTFKANSSDVLIDGGQEALEFINCGIKDPASVALFNAQNTNIRNPNPFS